MPELLILEDEASLNSGIALSLKQPEYHIRQAFSVSEAKAVLQSSRVDLMILDINLPDGSGLSLCEEIRKTSLLPIIFLTAKDLETDVVTGLALGGDDYVTKPFSLMILRAKVEALLRRASASAEPSVLTIDDFVFDFKGLRFTKAGKEVLLSRTEQKLLSLLVTNRGRTLPRELLVDRLWTDGAAYVDENALSVTVSRLRNKLEDNPAKPLYIQTVYGIGYAWGAKKNDGN